MACFMAGGGGRIGEWWKENQAGRSRELALSSSLPQCRRGDRTHGRKGPGLELETLLLSALPSLCSLDIQDGSHRPVEGAQLDCY